jgi:hypothetical protein
MNQPTDQHCPYCGVRIALILSADGIGAAANIGNTLLCMTCKSVSVFDEDLTLCKLTAEQYEHLKTCWLAGLFPYPPKLS